MADAPSSPRLSVDVVHGDGAPVHRLVVLHGIYGAGRNWGSVVRRVLPERPGWEALLVDLRGHGDSPPMEPPHTVEATARDLVEACGDWPPDAVLGHSFGGKVALEYARQAAAGGQAPAQVWVVDSTPGLREPDGSAWDMLDVIRGHPGPWATRGEGVAALEGAGVATPVARWMATNLEEGEDGYRWRLDVDQMESLLRDFFDRDLWPVVESPPEGTEVHLVKASRSSVLGEEDVARAEAAAEKGDRTFVHFVEGGHWLNADNPDALVELLVRHLP